jgi:two-component system sensor histidine kinase KdpD
VFEHPPAWFSQTPNELAAAQWVFDHQQWAGRGTDTLPGSQGFYLPLAASGKPLGVIGVPQGTRQDLLERDQRHMLETFATQIGIALERAEFADQARKARVAAESEELRNSLLSCVSHDLRTPLATIAGSASALVDDDGGLAAETRRELAQSIYDEGVRLNQLVGKLLDMTRLESPGLRLSREWFPLEELVGTALTRLESGLRGHKVETSIAADLPLVHVDGVLVVELLVNLLENAVRYTPQDSTIRVEAGMAEGGVRVEVLDEGPGLQPGSEEQVFGKFVRDRPRTDRRGAGLGLAICRAIAQLHGGQIGAENRPGCGAGFWFTLPVGSELPPSAAPPSESPTRGAVEEASA